jgi:dienelactone hydrolase
MRYIRAETDCPVIVLHELPGLGRPVVDFAHRLVEAGFQVHVPHLFGIVGKRQPRKNYTALCVSREFANLAAGVSAPITFWLRELAKYISKEASASRVGAIGMCLTGAFVIPLVLEPCVVAPVSSQPGVPFSILYLYTGLGGTKWARQLNVSNSDIAAASARLTSENITLLAFRFEKDRLCPPARFARLREAFGLHLEAHEYPCRSLFRRCFAPRHSVLTEQYQTSGQPREPSNVAFQRVCEFLRENLTRS